MEESVRKAPVRARTAAKPAAKAAVRPKAAPRATAGAPVDRETRIRVAAYLRAEQRGFAPGYELDDWFAAELEVSERDEASTRTTSATRSRKAATRKPATG